MTRGTLSNALDPRDNGLNALRLLLALLVIVSHSLPVGGWGEDPALGDLSLGHLAVAGFFGISGYLITGSRLRSPFRPYLWRRFLRIFPGFWACLVVTAFVFAPVAQLLGSGRWQVGPAILYVVSNAPMVAGGHPTIGDTLSSSAFPSSWNASMWTLRWEFLAYLIVGVALAVPRVRKLPWIWVAGWLATSVLNAVLIVRGTQGPLQEFAFLMPFFLAGAVLLQYRDRIPVAWPFAAAAAAVLVASCLAHVGSVAAPLPVAYLALWIGSHSPRVVRRVGSRNDYSYGTYLYAFPVQQLLTIAGVPALGLPVYIAASILGTAPFAVASWWFIERPATRLKDLGRLRRDARSISPTAAIAAE